MQSTCLIFLPLRLPLWLLDIEINKWLLSLYSYHISFNFTYHFYNQFCCAYYFKIHMTFVIILTTWRWQIKKVLQRKQSGLWPVFCLNIYKSHIPPFACNDCNSESIYITCLQHHLSILYTIITCTNHLLYITYWILIKSSKRIQELNFSINTWWAPIVSLTTKWFHESQISHSSTLPA